MDFASLFSRLPSEQTPHASGRRIAAVSRDRGTVDWEVGVKRKREQDCREDGKGGRVGQNCKKKKRQERARQEKTWGRESGRSHNFLEMLDRYQKAKAEAPPIQRRKGGVQEQDPDRCRAGEGSGREHHSSRDLLRTPGSWSGLKQNAQREQHAARKNKRKKSKNQSDTQGQGSDRHDNSNKKTGERGGHVPVKRQPLMSQEFISQHAVEHEGRHICRFFLSGRCIKEDQCKFEHEMVVLEKKAELCKYYVQDRCTKGEYCTYMHKEYPCKFFHTGTICYQGNQCKFSHDPLTEVTRVLLQKVLNGNEDSVETADQEKQEKSPSVTAAVGQTPGQGFRPNFYNRSCPSEDLVQNAAVCNREVDVWAEGAFGVVPSSEHPLGSSSSSRLQEAEAAQQAHQGCGVRRGDGEFQKRGHAQSEAAEPLGRAGYAEEGEGDAHMLRAVPVVIPLEATLGMVLQDPRKPGSAHTHVSFCCPAFAREVLWAAEDLTQLCFPSCDQDDPMEEQPVSMETVSPSKQDRPPASPAPVKSGQPSWVPLGHSPAVHNLPVQVLTQWGRPVSAGLQQTQARVQIQTQCKTSSHNQAEPRSQNQTQCKTSSHNQTEPRSHNQTQCKTSSQNQTEPRSQIQTHCKTSSQIQTQCKTSSQNQTEPRSQNQTQCKTSSQNQPEPSSQTQNEPSGSSLFRNIFKMPLPLLSANESSV